MGLGVSGKSWLHDHLVPGQPPQGTLGQQMQMMFFGRSETKANRKDEPQGLSPVLVKRSCVDHERGKMWQQKPAEIGGPQVRGQFLGVSKNLDFNSLLFMFLFLFCSVLR